MAYPVLISKAPGHLGQRGVISPEGQFVPKEEVSPDHPCDIGFGLEIGAPSVKELTPDQKRTALALLDQTVAKAREFLGEKPRTGFQPGMVVKVYQKEPLLTLVLIAVIEAINERTICFRSLDQDGREILFERPVDAHYLRLIPDIYGMSGLWGFVRANEGTANKDKLPDDLIVLGQKMLDDEIVGTGASMGPVINMDELRMLAQEFATKHGETCNIAELDKMPHDELLILRCMCRLDRVLGGVPEALPSHDTTERTALMERVLCGILEAAEEARVRELFLEYSGGCAQLHAMMDGKTDVPFSAAPPHSSLIKALITDIKKRMGESERDHDGAWCGTFSAIIPGGKEYRSMFIPLVNGEMVRIDLS